MAGLFDASTLAETAGVRGVRQTGPRTFQLIVDDAGTATRRHGRGDVGAQVARSSRSREIRPTFEEVFTALVERDRAQHEADATTAADAQPPWPTQPEAA